MITSKRLMTGLGLLAQSCLAWAAPIDRHALV